MLARAPTSVQACAARNASGLRRLATRRPTSVSVVYRCSMIRFRLGRVADRSIVGLPLRVKMSSCRRYRPRRSIYCTCCGGRRRRLRGMGRIDFAIRAKRMPRKQVCSSHVRRVVLIATGVADLCRRSEIGLLILRNQLAHAFDALVNVILVPRQRGDKIAAFESSADRCLPPATGIRHVGYRTCRYLSRRPAPVG